MVAVFSKFVYGDVVYAQTWQVLTLKNCMEPFAYASTAYLVASALVSVRLFCKNLGNLQEFFGQMVYRPPWQKIARTPMVKSPSSPLFFATLFCQGGSLEIEIMVIARFSLQQSRQFIFIAKWHFRSKNSTIS